MSEERSQQDQCVWAQGGAYVWVRNGNCYNGGTGYQWIDLDVAKKLKGPGVMMMMMMIVIIIIIIIIIIIMIMMITT